MMFAMLVELLLLGGIVAALLLWYGNRRKMEWYTFVVAYLGWFTGMSTVVVLPIDIVSVRTHPFLHLTAADSSCPRFHLAQGRHRKCLLDNVDTPDLCAEPSIYVSQEALYIYWEVVYWTAFVLCWCGLDPYHPLLIVPSQGRHGFDAGIRQQRRFPLLAKDAALAQGAGDPAEHCRDRRHRRDHLYRRDAEPLAVRSPFSLSSPYELDGIGASCRAS